MKKQIHLNAFTQCCIGHHSMGQWKHPLDRPLDGYRNVHYWIELARLLEKGCFDSLFLADVHGTYATYRGSRDTAVRHGLQFPGNDPTLIIPAMAAATRHLGFASTFSTTYFPPYHTAKLFSTLDHLTDGRVGWNIVTSYLPDANANFGLGPMMAHDERYERAEEYMAVCYQLWEHSWEAGAMVRDRVNDLLIDPSKVHEINFKGRYFEVPGPHMCEPSRQRTPVLYQAGGSERGVKFAARHAEAVFGVHHSTAACQAAITTLTRALVAEGRRRQDVKYFPGVTVVVAPTDAEARLKLETCRRYASPEGGLALFCGWLGIDLSKLESGKTLKDQRTDAIATCLNMLAAIDPEREWTLEEVGAAFSIGSVFPKIVGSPGMVADELERWLEETDCDGFNLMPVTQPQGFADFVDLVVPELQRRGLLRTHYAGQTLRERHFGVGQQRLDPTHIAHRSLPPWKRRAASSANGPAGRSPTGESVAAK
ncbi:MAG: LLM class flavin-dependent oxidoreductase [Gammaproteobacteria bacterium]|nr:LLM class flavin-dependent oxidoreductase [Gammaproteobacteria bacterium]